MAEAGAQAPGQGRRDARFIGDVPGCFVFLDRVGREWEAQTFSFSARSVSTSKAVVTCETPVEKGERVALRFDTIGIRRGVVERPTAEGFAVRFTEENDGEAGVDARIGWLNRKVRGRAEDRRDYRRVVPKHADAILVLGADNYLDCKLKDMSRSGASVTAKVQPPIGSLLAVGSVPGRVVRHFDGGFAVKFLVVQVEAELEALLTLRTAREKSLAAARLGFAA